jgi:hypothetical protein
MEAHPLDARGDRVWALDVTGEKLERLALTPIVDGADFAVVWVCREEAWDDGVSSEDLDTIGVPWPAEDVFLRE